MRIAFLSWRDSTHPDGGGSEVFVEEIAAELVRRGHQVTLRCAAHGDAPAEETRQGVRLLRRGGRLTVYPRALAWLLLGDGRQYDVVVDVVNGLPFGAPIARRRGVVALVHHVHREQWRMIYPGLRGAVGWFVESRVTPRLYRRVPHVTVSEASRADLSRLGIDDVTVVRNGTPEAPAGRLPRALTPRVCVLARLVPHKQIEHAIDVVAALRVEGVDVSLDLIGDGWWRDQLEAHVARTDATSYVTFHGHVDVDHRSDLLGQAWLMLLPSVKEGWGIAVLEAAAQGTPTVAYRAAGGVRESVLDGQTGRLVDGPSGLLTAVRDLLGDRDELGRLGTAARTHSQRFTWVASAEAFEAACAASVAKRPAH